MFNVKCTVKSVKGDCAAGYKVGDYFHFKEGAVLEPVQPKGACMHAVSALLPYLTAYARQTPDDDWINMIDELQCPDAANTVVFGLERE
ncbi:MAG: TIGR04076 family protein [Proteobacteria bacterium]|nr:TIGR04076 family protein [Pseudomonadota bacterium]